jgi:hypothetical protein
VECVIDTWKRELVKLDGTECPEEMKTYKTPTATFHWDQNKHPAQSYSVSETRRVFSK